MSRQVAVEGDGGEAKTQSTKQAGKELKKEIVLVDKSSSEVSLTLWGNNAENLDLSNAPILAAKNVTVSGNEEKTHLFQIKIIFF